jgi:hypothetical protein
MWIQLQIARLKHYGEVDNGTGEQKREKTYS